METYLKQKERHQKEFGDFKGIFFAFSFLFAYASRKMGQTFY